MSKNGIKSFEFPRTTQAKYKQEDETQDKNEPPTNLLAIVTKVQLQRSSRTS